MRTRYSRIALMFTGGSVAFAAAISTTLAAQQSNVQTASGRPMEETCDEDISTHDGSA